MLQIIQTLKGEILVKELPYDGMNKSLVQSEIAKLLADHLQMNPLHIQHTETGKPYIEEKPDLKISISHSAQWIAVYLSEKAEVGVDIEGEKQAIFKAKPLFINETEVDIFKSFSLSYLHIIWGAKEAIYKFYSGVFKDIQNDITIAAVDHKKKFVTANTIYGQVHLDFKFLNDSAYLVYC